MDTITFQDGIDELATLLDGQRRVLVLTGAGVSTDSGIPAYRDHDGEWAHPPPMQAQVFRGSDLARRRYWARSMLGWSRMGRSAPGPAHAALATLEEQGRIHHLVTQNVDGLHLRAGSRAVTELHGSVHRLVCLACAWRGDRRAFQDALEAANRGWAARWVPDDADGEVRPDGDLALPVDDAAYAAFHVPPCPACGGALKPDVVFFGENVPKPRVEGVYAALDAADLLLVAGSSLTVFSGYRFVRRACRDGTPVVAVNLGRTRGDDDFTLKVTAPVGPVLDALAAG